MKTPRGLNLEEAIEFLKWTHENMTKTERGDLQGIDADTAFEAGYRVAIADLEASTRKVQK